MIFNTSGLATFDLTNTQTAIRSWLAGPCNLGNAVANPTSFFSGVQCVIKAGAAASYTIEQLLAVGSVASDLPPGLETWYQLRPGRNTPIGFLGTITWSWPLPPNPPAATAPWYRTVFTHGSCSRGGQSSFLTAYLSRNTSQSTLGIPDELGVFTGFTDEVFFDSHLGQSGFILNFSGTFYTYEFTCPPK